MWRFTMDGTEANIYINELSKESNESEIVFADDTAIYYEDSSWRKLKAKVENDLSSVK